MPASFAASAHPTGSAIAWSDSESIVVEIPCPGNPPYIARYPKTANGLRAALNILLENPAPKVLASPHPAVQRKATATVEQREAAAAVVRRLFK